MHQHGGMGMNQGMNQGMMPGMGPGMGMNPQMMQGFQPPPGRLSFKPPKTESGTRKHPPKTESGALQTSENRI